MERFVWSSELITNAESGKYNSSELRRGDVAACRGWHHGVGESWDGLGWKDLQTHPIPHPALPSLAHSTFPEPRAQGRIYPKYSISISFSLKLFPFRTHLGINLLCVRRKRGSARGSHTAGTGSSGILGSLCKHQH